MGYIGLQTVYSSQPLNPGNNDEARQRLELVIKAPRINFGFKLGSLGSIRYLRPPQNLFCNFPYVKLFVIDLFWYRSPIYTVYKIS